MQLILASSSPYRRALLSRLGLPFISASPEIDETPVPGETVQGLVERLALGKANALAGKYPDALIIGSDQACLCGTTILGKPGNLACARAQLQACSGKQVDFYTGLVLLDSESGAHQYKLDVFSVVFRTLTEAEIENYLQRERPFDCAGSFKAEGLGISLFEKMEGADFHSLIGLPLISLCDLLRKAGLNPLLQAPQEPA
jgi:septum formation protein